MPRTSYKQAGRATGAKNGEYQVVSNYRLGYRNREDITNLPAGVLIVGSKNVVSDVSERLGVRKGYDLDGATSNVMAAILSSFDWQSRGNGERHLRSGFSTNPGVTVTIASPAVFTASQAHGYAAGQALSLTTTGALPTGLIAGTVYYVIAAGLTATSFELSATPGGTAMDTSGTQSGIHTANDGKLQYRYGDTVATWRDLIVGVPNVSYNYTTYWNAAESVREALFVNGQSQITSWNGATAEIASAAPSILTKTGTDSWLDSGFYSSTSGRSVTIGGVQYSYTGGETTTTLNGVTPDPSLIAAGSVAHQTPMVTLNSAMSGITSTFQNGLISVLNNQVFVGALNSSVLWISKVNSYTDYTSSTPRQVGEGASLILDDSLVALQPQESFMYVSAGTDRWYNVSFEVQTSTVGVTYEQVKALPLKTGRRQGAMSQAFVSHIKNDIVVVTFEPTIDTFGRVETSLATPQTTNISDSIKLDVDGYDFAGGSIAYHRYNVYVALPAEGLVLKYSMDTQSWETPLEIPVTRFYVVNGELYGHSSQTSESYRLFYGTADRVYPGFAGYPINAVMRFSYESFGSRFTLKRALSLYVEGYIGAGTSVDATVTYELDGCATSVTKTIDGSDSQIVCLSTSGGSLGKASLGKSKLGGSGTMSLTGLPPKFRVEKTFQNTDFFESSVTFSLLGTNSEFFLVAFGLSAAQSTQEPTYIRQ